MCLSGRLCRSVRLVPGQRFARQNNRRQRRWRLCTLVLHLAVVVYLSTQLWCHRWTRLLGSFCWTRRLFSPSRELAAPAATTAASTPLARAFSFGLLTSAAAFGRCCGVIRRSSRALDRRHHLIGLNGPLVLFNSRRRTPGFSTRPRCSLVDDVHFFVFFEKKVGNVQKGVALQAYVDKSRLHAGQHAGHASFVNGAGEGVFVLA